MIRQRIILFLAAWMLLAFPGPAPAVDLKSDTWAATDGLGRSLPGYEEAGPPRPGKTVGVFYFLWLGAHGTQGPFDNSEILAANPDAPRWGPLGQPHHWGQPELGYYLSTDEYVIRKHAQALSDAGVDVIIFDVTNGFTYSEQYHKLCQTFLAVRGEGGQTPQIAFLLPFWTVQAHTVAKKLYADLYGPGLYQELWFQWGGRPLMLADPAVFNWELKDFFTFRTPQGSYFDGPTGPDQWGWLEVWPQHGFYNSAGEVEQAPVGVAQNAVGQVLAPMSDPPGGQGPFLAGIGRGQGPGGWGHRPRPQLRRAVGAGPGAGPGLHLHHRLERVGGLADQRVDRRGPVHRPPGRDLRGLLQPGVQPGHRAHGRRPRGQLLLSDDRRIRRFKGVRGPESAGPPGSIKIDGDFSDWEDVTPSFLDTPGDTAPRNHPGWGDAGTYTDFTGRNDFVELKAARDSGQLYFHARTQGDISEPEPGNWMLLFIDVDQDPATGWEGYDFAVNLEPGENGRTSLSAWDGQGGWETVRRDIPYRVSGAELELAIPRPALGLSGGGVALDFHWADNIQELGDIAQFARSGDSAPNRRFNYRYQAD